MKLGKERDLKQSGPDRKAERAIEKALRTNQRIEEAKRAVANEFVNFSSTSKISLYPMLTDKADRLTGCEQWAIKALPLGIEPYVLVLMTSLT